MELAGAAEAFPLDLLIQTDAESGRLTKAGQSVSCTPSTPNALSSTLMSIGDWFGTLAATRGVTRTQTGYARLTVVAVASNIVTS